MNEKIKEAASKAVGHLSARREWSPPTWLLYAIGALALVGLLYGGIQQARICRWSRIMGAAKERIASLEASQAQAKYQGVRQATSRAVKQLDKRKVKLRQRLQQQRRSHQATTRKIPQMSPEQLKEAFREEGF